MDLKLQQNNALIAGGTSGLGFGCAMALVEEGCNVAICGRDQERLAAAAEKLREAATDEAQVLPIIADVMNDSDVSDMVESFRDTLGPVDILITNAGGPPTGRAEDLSDKQLRHAYELTCLSAIRLIRLCLPDMMGNHWGRILAITSMSVKQPIPNLALSNVTRTALTAYLKTLSVEVAPHGITVNSILPGFHATDRMRSFLPEDKQSDDKALELFLEEKAATIPMRKVGDPDDFGRAAAFLCSHHANFITGITLPVDGGATLGLL